MITLKSTDVGFRSTVVFVVKNREDTVSKLSAFSWGETIDQFEECFCFLIASITAGALLDRLTVVITTREPSCLSAKL